MGIAATLDDFGKPAWIALTILGFVIYWPIGLAMLAFVIGSGRMGCWGRGRMGRWERRMERMQARAERWYDRQRDGAPSSGNRAFDEYRADTLKRLEEEQREFMAFLDRLRLAKDKMVFDQFLAERRRRPEGPGPEAQPQA
jgi:hypothetical protein